MVFNGFMTSRWFANDELQITNYDVDLAPPFLIDQRKAQGKEM